MGLPELPDALSKALSDGRSVHPPTVGECILFGHALIVTYLGHSHGCEKYSRIIRPEGLLWETPDEEYEDVVVLRVGPLGV